MKNLKSLAKTRTHTEEKTSKISNIEFRHFTFFLITILSTLESTSLDETIWCASKWFILTQITQNLEPVNLKCVTYAQPIPLPLHTESLQQGL